MRCEPKGSDSSRQVIKTLSSNNVALSYSGELAKIKSSFSQSFIISITNSSRHYE